MSDLLRTHNLTKVFPSGEKEITVLNNISFHVDKGETVAIVGPSGSGKTTLLGLCAGLEQPSNGEIWLCGEQLGRLTEDERATLRSQAVGFVFQTFQLIPTLTALENVMVPLELAGRREVREQSRALLSLVGLADREQHYPTQLSGGEQQRVALARAFVSHPQILFADEPTGNLDGANADNVRSIMFELNATFQTTLIIVTHDLNLARHSSRTIMLASGQITSDSSTAL